MQYTIEARELTSNRHRPGIDAGESRLTLEARDADEAISRFVDENQWQLVSVSRPRGRESIATVKKNDIVYLVRVYAN